jgi:hypothetical protein
MSALVTAIVVAIIYGIGINMSHIMEMIQAHSGVSAAVGGTVFMIMLIAGLCYEEKHGYNNSSLAMVLGVVGIVGYVVVMAFTWVLNLLSNPMWCLVVTLPSIAVVIFFIVYRADGFSFCNRQVDNR